MFELVSPLNKTNTQNALLRHKQDRQYWGNLHASAASLLLFDRMLSREGASLIVSTTLAEAERIVSELKLFGKGVEGAPKVLLFQDWETLPYDSFSPHQDIVSERVRCLYYLATNQRCCVVVAAATLHQRLAPSEHILSNSLLINRSDKLGLDDFRSMLSAAGYNLVDTVFQNGEFAVRGSLIDVYPMGSHAAYRVELFDDEVESIRTFDTETQRTIEKVERVQLLVGKEYPLDTKGIRQFKQSWHEYFNVDHKLCDMYQDVAAGLPPAGIEYYLTLFFEETSCLLDYLPAQTELYIQDGLDEALNRYWQEVGNRYQQMNIDVRRPLLPPHIAFFPSDEIYARIKQFSRAFFSAKKVDDAAGNINFNATPTANLEIDPKAEHALEKIEHYLEASTKRILFCAESSGRRETLKEQLSKIAVSPQEYDSIYAFIQSSAKIGIVVADLVDGFNGEHLALIAESQLFGNRVQQKRRRQKAQSDANDVVKNLTELKMNAPVVHAEQGVGRYRGLQTIAHQGQAEDFVVLEYADEAKLYVPVGHLHLISRYTGADEQLAPWHKLGSEQWQKAKRKAAEKVRDVAAELLEIYARRKAKKGFAHQHPEDDYKTFCAGFPFEETPDQSDAIDAVLGDMLAPQPMDRLVCGDVGFGKTEVAMRATFIAIQNEKQVAVLVPTTLLAQQHYENFKDRFADWPVSVAVLSRFRSGKETKDALQKLSEGKIDIIVGTHKLLQSDVKFKNLGLMVIDEEHRFGVRQKEALKSMRAEVDVLTMTATPIPRTLNMSMAGIRDLSIIATPPAKRLSIKTFVREREDNIIKEAILREIMRGGQVYFLHNEVKSIAKTASELAELVPDAKIQIGHGQMRERELEAVMSDFYHKRFNVLVCSTIIETGIDVPSANTIIIERADKFGLAQLHQLRGRVGRSHHQAYAYLLTPNKRAMTGDALKRLEAIEEAQDLGAGFTLASHDMEIRGAGELLGDEQSGQIQTVGFSMYMDMLDRAVKAIRENKVIKLEEPANSGAEINLRIPALIPDDYVGDVHTRLILYKRLASTSNKEELETLQVEMIDRFGLLPGPTKNLFQQTLLRLEAEHLGIVKVETNQHGGRIEFDKDTRIEAITLVNLVQRSPERYRLEGANHLKFTFPEKESPVKESPATESPMEASQARIKQVNILFQQLAS